MPRRWLGSRPRIVLAGFVVLVAGGAIGFTLTRPASSAPARPDSVIAAARRKPAAALSGGTALVPPPISLQRYRGRVLFVNFWASWCIPCRKEAPQLARFDRGLDSRAALVGVDVNDKRGDALRFIHRFSWRYPNTADSGSRILRRYHLLGIPTTFVVDPQGRIAARLLGPQTTTSLETVLRKIEAGGSA